VQCEPVTDQSSVLSYVNFLDKFSWRKNLGVGKSLKQRKFYVEKMKGIKEEKNTFGEVYCSREEGLVCMDRKCKSVGMGKGRIIRI
jgi:hypothetical protein